jgi:predicted transcriptional regulator
MTVKRWLEKLAKSFGRTALISPPRRSASISMSTSWQVAGIKQAMASLDRGDAVDHQQVKDWIASWGGKNELPTPDSRTTQRGHGISREPAKTETAA